MALYTSLENSMEWYKISYRYLILLMENASETIIHIAHPAWEWACTTFYTAYNCAVSTLYIVCQWLDNLLKYLDPSLFQTVIIAAIAIYIPFIISHTTDIMVMDKKRDELTRMVINDELLQGKNFFIHTIAGVFLFSFASGVDSHLSIKLLSIIGVVYLICFYWQSLKKAFLFSEGKQPEFEMSFLKKLVLPGKYRIFKDKATPERMIKVWTSLWSRTNIESEMECTRIFTSHMDAAISKHDIKLATNLLEIYIENINNRNTYSIGIYVLPKFFQCHEKLWNMAQKFFSENRKQKKLTGIKAYLNKTTTSTSTYQHLLYKHFRSNLFKSIAERLLKDKDISFIPSFFSEFKQHINKYKEQYDVAVKSQNDEHVPYQNYITEFVDIFLPIFLEELEHADEYRIKEYRYPDEWQVNSINSKNIIARIVSVYFMKWAQPKFFPGHVTKESYNTHLELSIRCIFPNIHPYLFRAFLALYHCRDIKESLKSAQKIPVWDTELSSDALYLTKSEYFIKRQEKDALEKEETIQIILKFYRWDKLTITEDDISPKQYKDWKNYSNEEQQSIIYKVRKKKLSDLKKELKSTEITKFCTEGTIEESKAKEIRRTEFLELTDLLLKAIEKPV